MNGEMRGPVVQTTFGPVRGIEDHGVDIFKGIRFGADTSGSNRFLPPKAPQPWSIVLDCSDAPPIASQRSFFQRKYSQVLRGAYDARLEDTAHYVRGSEDCLFLNVWSPHMENTSRAPVIIWFHPGGQNGWSGVSPWTDGTNLARNENVVVVSFNHRLGPFGFLYLSDSGHDGYAEAANVGLHDMIAVLRWVNENISAFGGDPGNITIMGESGGAGKVCALLASTAAVGLFHKAIVMGGAPPRVRSREKAAKRTAEILDSLQIEGGKLDKLQYLAAEDLLRAVGDNHLSFVAAGAALDRHPFDPTSPTQSSDIPLMIGTAVDEMTYLTLADAFPETLDERGAIKQLASWVNWGFDDEISSLAMKAIKSLYSDTNWRDALLLAATAAYRDDHIFMAEQKLAGRAAPVFMYLFGWHSPLWESYGAMHTFDVPFAFANTSAARHLFDSQCASAVSALAANISKAWATFARRGNPSHSGIPNWIPYSTSRRETMILNYDCTLVNDPMRATRLAFSDIRNVRLAARRQL